MTELLPCPFCGGEADQVLTDYEQVQVEEVRCRDCWATVGGATEAAAILAWNHRAPIPATPDRMADVTLGAEAMLDAKAECNCHAHSWEEHTDECAACNGMGYKSILIQKDNPLHVPDCPICHGTGKPSQGEGDK